MTPKLTCMTEGGVAGAWTRGYDGGELGERFMSGVSKTTVPQGGSGDGDQGVSSREVQRVQGPRAIAPDDQIPG